MGRTVSDHAPNPTMAAARRTINRRWRNAKAMILFIMLPYGKAGEHG